MEAEGKVEGGEGWFEGYKDMVTVLINTQKSVPELGEIIFF